MLSFSPINGTTPSRFLSTLQRWVVLQSCKPIIFWSNISCRNKQFEKAKEPLNWMWEQGLKPYVFSYGTLINALAKNGYMSDAFKLFDEMPERGVTPDVACYNILIDGFFKKGDLLDANEIWERLFTQTFFLITLLLMVSVNVGRLDESLEIWRSMKENERVQDLFTYSTCVGRGILMGL